MARIISRVQTTDFDVASELARLNDDARCGAMASFIGTVRQNPAAPLTTLTLEHYPGMTERVMQQLAETACQRFDLAAVTLIHRVGPLRPGEQIVLVLAASAHRKAALTAVDYLMDHLKSCVPFWKCETTAQGAHWVDARASDEEALRQWQSSTP